MGIFDLFSKKNTNQGEQVLGMQMSNIAPTVPMSEKKYYQNDEYYTKKTHEGTIFEKTVTSFEMRKKTCIPSERGLYVAEILLLEYCSYGNYPGPKNGYPGFWWFEYGIRDVAATLKSLEDRGYIQYSSPKNAVSGWKVAELKELLQKYGLPTSGKKADLIAIVQSSIPDQEFLNLGFERKYELTPLGQQELADNAYVPYMHKHPHKTDENDRFGKQFNVWSINRALGYGSKTNWRNVVDRIEKNIEQETIDRNTKSMEKLKKTDPKLYGVLKSQDDQLAAINRAEAKYKADKDIDYLVGFWEYLWAHGGLKFEGVYWHFRLADLYIQQKRYDDALAFCKRIKKSKKNYADKANSYIVKIEEKKEKSKKK